jgi:hypothetical protein
MSKKPKYSKILLVEGNDDMHVVYALCEKFSVPQTFSIKDCKGIDNLFPEASVQFKGTNIDTVGIIIDADIDLSKRWRQIQLSLSKVFSDLPKELPSDGLIYSEDDKKVGIWMMPNNLTSGMLEDFIRFLVPDDDLLLPKVKDFLEDIESKEQNKYKPIHRTKAEISSWLALQEDPGTPMGLSITKRYLTVEKDECEVFVNWLIELFK